MKLETLEVAGIKQALYGMRNPKNSWDKTDTGTNMEGKLEIGENDLKLAQNLIKAGTEHCKFLRQIQVWCNIDMPRYWWSEMDTYRFVEKNSCSTMHKLLNKQAEISKNMFITCTEDEDILDVIIERLNEIRQTWLNAETEKEKVYCILRAKRILPEGMLQFRTINTNYQELRNIYKQRKHHRLKEEWQDNVCRWIESLPYSDELITYGLK